VAPAEATARFSPYRLYNDEVSYVGSMAVLHSFDRARELAVGLGLGWLVINTLPLNGYAGASQQVRGGGGLEVQVAPERP
jgi:hypothetical protein